MGIRTLSTQHQTISTIEGFSEANSPLLAGDLHEKALRVAPTRHG